MEGSQLTFIQGLSPNSNTVIQNVSYLYAELQEYLSQLEQQRTSIGNFPTSVSQQEWLPQPEGTIKMNCDVDMGGSYGVVAVVAKNTRVYYLGNMV
ncbi:hypothetical protein PanWU01x14_185380 [Parasponia andersonii]|uniref:Uncharacterized protein n=1 Tax=Parasponia andersonii TaxID=3476 RepID=A0A2P5C436_PARAD|nr:hypothetical protein PanWU01x14_185380 [Parasponia andersonii]